MSQLQPNAGQSPFRQYGMVDLAFTATIMVRAAGVHVTLPDYYSPEHLGMIVPKTKDGRVVFMLPWLEATIAGTTGLHFFALMSSAAWRSLRWHVDETKWPCTVLRRMPECIVRP